MNKSMASSVALCLLLLVPKVKREREIEFVRGLVVGWGRVGVSGGAVVGTTLCVCNRRLPRLCAWCLQ